MSRRDPKVISVGVLLLLAATIPLAAGDVVGETSYVDGDADIYRAGSQLDAAQAGIGAPVENFDILTTGRNGTIEVMLTAGPSPETSIRVDPNTSFTVEVGMVKSQPRATVNMITGTISLKVKRIAGPGGLEVKTDSAIMGVRGTQFSVTTPPSGDILITCSEGEVACTDEDGTELLARPGTAVEKIVGERFRTIPVAVSSLQTFRSQWNAERVAALRSNAARAIQAYAARYDELARRFDTQYRTLMQQSDILNTWAGEEERGQTPASDSARTMMEKKRVIGSLLALRATLFIFERVYFRLVELEEYHREGYGRGRLPGGISTEDFFGRIAQERGQLAARLPSARSRSPTS